MDLVSSIQEYIGTIKNNPYVYSIQKIGIEAFLDYIKSNDKAQDIEHLSFEMIEEFLLYWVPRSKKYLTYTQAYHLVYTLQDMYAYICKIQKKSEDMPAILDLYGEEYMRMYKVRGMLARLTQDPIIRVSPTVIDLEAYRCHKMKTKNKEGFVYSYEQGIFQVVETKSNGQVIVKKISEEKYCKLILEYPIYKYFKEGDLLHGKLKKRMFYIYWELEEVKSYYLSKAISYL